MTFGSNAFNLYEQELHYFSNKWKCLSPKMVVLKPCIACEDITALLMAENHIKNPGGLLLGILGGGVPPDSPNPDPISDQKMSFSTPIFRTGLYKIRTRFQTWR